MTEQQPPTPAGIAPPGFPAGYLAVREIGSGSWGTVVLARQSSVDRLVAVKAIIGGGRAGEEAVARFRREARTLASLEHPAVVRVIELAKGDDDLFLVMEYVEGRTLRELLDSGTTDVAARLTVLSDVAAALTAAAGRGVVHRDVKPANVLVRPNGRAKLADFGLARLLGDSAAFRTAVGTLTGTPAYLSPEQAAGSDELGPETDAYSFGVLAYEAMVGTLPHDDTGIDAVLRQHREGVPRPPSTLLRGFPRTAERVLLAALSVDPARRPLPAQLAAVLRDIPPQRWPTPVQAAGGRHQEPELTEGGEVERPTGAGATPFALREQPARGMAALPLPFARVDPPVFDPGRRVRHPRQRMTVGLVLLALAGGTWLAIDRGRADGLRVTSLRLTVTPVTGRCPAADFDITAVVGTNGREGRVSLVWTRPDGTATQPQSVLIADGRRAVSARLHYAVSGSRPFTGSATAELPGLDRRASALIHYSCP